MASEADIADAPSAQAVTAEPAPMRAARAKPVAALVAAHRLRTPRIIDAMGAVRRDLFVPEALVAQAYDDHPRSPSAPGRRSPSRPWSPP